MQSKVKPFLNLAQIEARLIQIKKNITDCSMEVSSNGKQLTVKRKEGFRVTTPDLALEFMQACLDKEFEVANENSAQNLLSQITEYLNQPNYNDIDIICAGIQWSNHKPFVPLVDGKLDRTKVIADLVFKYGLVAMQDAVDFKVENLFISNNVIKICSVPMN